MATPQYIPGHEPDAPLAARLHPQARLNSAVFVDKKLERLIPACWKRGWFTNNSCQANFPNALFAGPALKHFVWICFNTRSMAIAFLEFCTPVIGDDWSLVFDVSAGTGEHSIVGSVRFPTKDLPAVEEHFGIS